MDQVWIVYYPIHRDYEKELWQYQDEIPAADDFNSVGMDANVWAGTK